MDESFGALHDRSLIKLPQRSLRNPTVWIFATALFGFVTAVLLYARSVTNRFATSGLSIASLYCLYTVTHEAVHGNAHPDPRVNRLMGTVSAAIEGMTLPLFRIIHLQHHAFTNDPAHDPDFVIGRKPRWLLPIWTLVRLTHDNFFMFRNRLWSSRPRQFKEHLATVAMQFGIVVVTLLSGHFAALVWVWLGPVLISGAILELTVAWVVHYPHVSQHPLENTRVFHGRLLQVVMLNQNYHLVHHLWTRIPWYRYSLAAEGAEREVKKHRELGRAGGTSLS